MFFNNQHSQSKFKTIDSLSPIVSTLENFDYLLIPKDHPGRAPTDTYYINENTVLRTHTSAHQFELLKSKQSNAYLITSDVYRRDEIDATHYPVFHQMEGLYLLNSNNLINNSDVSNLNSNHSSQNNIDINDNVEITTPNTHQLCHSAHDTQLLSLHLKKSLEALMRHLFSKEKNLKIRWIEGYFPFTHPSWEMEVFYNGKWLEVCGCGVIRQEILNQTGNQDKIGWAFGLGLERIAMVLFDIPDIRLFWSKDPRFLNQFTSEKIVKFIPFSKYPSCYKDVSFWCSSDFHDNDFAEVVRGVAGDLVASVELLDTFKHPKTNRISKCYRITYSSMERTMSNEEVDGIQEQVRETIKNHFKFELR